MMTVTAMDFTPGTSDRMRFESVVTCNDLRDLTQCVFCVNLSRAHGSISIGPPDPVFHSNPTKACNIMPC